MKKASIVLGLLFGDEGKGRTVDFLCENPDNKKCVIRFNGGQQAGHTVIFKGIKHVFSNYGSGTLRGVPTYFTQHTSIYPPTIKKEYDILLDKGITPVLIVHPLAMVTTPYDVAYNRIEESKLLHGSCGLGINTTVKRHLGTPHKLLAIDLLSTSITMFKLAQIKKYYLGIIPEKEHETFFDLLADINEINFINLLDNNLFKIDGYNYLMQFDNLVFEGAQGIMLDAEHGLFPHVTYSNTTSKNAIEVCNILGIKPEIYYVTRCYQTRHGAGWMSNEEEIKLINNEEEINVENKWQGKFRIGKIDYKLIEHAINIDNSYSAGLDKNIVVTCLDQIPDFVFNPDRINVKFKNCFEFYSPSNEILLKKDMLFGCK